MDQAEVVMFVGVWSTEVVDLALNKLNRLERRHAVRYHHLVEGAVQRSFGRRAVVADDVVDQRVVEHFEVLERVNQASDMVVGMLQESGIYLHLPRKDRFQLIWHVVPRGYLL